MGKSFGIISFVLLLAILFSVLVVSPLPRVSAQSNLDEGVFVIDCDTGEQLIGGVVFTFININPGTTPRITAIGIDGFDPVLAVITEPGVGRCNDDASRVKGSQVALPGLGLVEADELAAQVTVNASRGGFVDVVVGGFQGKSGRFAMVVEELAINPRDELDGFLISVPKVVANEPLGVFMVARSGSSLDPYLEVYGGAGLQTDELDFNQIQLLGSCDDAGAGNCTDTPAFPGGGTDITNGYRYEAGSLDAGLVFSLGSTEKFLYTFGSSGSQSTGNYGIIVVGTVPGELTTTGTGNMTGSLGSSNTQTTPACNNVAASISDASTTYSDDFAPNLLLDGNPLTGWSTAENDTNPFFVVNLGGQRTVNSIQFDSYSYVEDFEADSIKDFNLVVLSADGKLQTIFQGTAQLVQGYQVYTFNPVTTNELGVQIISNYGGGFFAAAEIRVCGQ